MNDLCDIDFWPFGLEMVRDTSCPPELYLCQIWHGAMRVVFCCRGDGWGRISNTELLHCPNVWSVGIIRYLGRTSHDDPMIGTRFKTSCDSRTDRHMYRQTMPFIDLFVAAKMPVRKPWIQLYNEDILACVPWMNDAPMIVDEIQELQEAINTTTTWTWPTTKILELRNASNN